jgi:hypothetical protein
LNNGSIAIDGDDGVRKGLQEIAGKESFRHRADRHGSGRE